MNCCLYFYLLSSCILFNGIVAQIEEISNIKIAFRSTNAITIKWANSKDLQKITLTLLQLDICQVMEKKCVALTADNNFECKFQNLEENAKFKLLLVGCKAPVGDQPAVCNEPISMIVSTLPTEPRTVEVYDIEASSALVAWSAPPSNGAFLDKYVATAVHIGTQEEAACEIVANESCDTYCIITGMKSNSAYRVTVKACLVDNVTKKMDCSAASVAAYFTTAVAYIDLPQIGGMLLILLVDLTLIILASWNVKDVEDSLD